jgi:hypothetical protein
MTARVFAVLHDRMQRLTHLLKVRRSTIQPAQRCLGIGDRCSDGLFGLMRD